MKSRTKKTGEAGIVAVEHGGTQKVTKYVYEPGNATRYEVWLTFHGDEALVSLWPGQGSAASCCVLQTHGYLHESYVAQKLGVGEVDALVLAIPRLR